MIPWLFVYLAEADGKYSSHYEHVNMLMLASTVVVQSQTSLYSAASQLQKKVSLQQLSFRCRRAKCSGMFVFHNWVQRRFPCKIVSGEPVYCSLSGVEPWLVYVRTVSEHVTALVLWACFVLCFLSACPLSPPPPRPYVDVHTWSHSPDDIKCCWFWCAGARVTELQAAFSFGDESSVSVRVTC